MSPSTFSGTGTSAFSGAGVSQFGEWWLLLFGDSKTQVSATDTWQDPLAVQGRTATGRVWSWFGVGIGGRTVATTLAAMTAMLATMPLAVGAADIRVLINLGVNDITGGLPAEATWEADYLSIIDQIHTKWPTARVYLTTPWLIGNPSPTYDTQCATLAGWIATIVAARSAFVQLGDDERIWLKGSDSGATNTYDGTHYSVAGNVAAVAAKAAVLWP